MVNPNTVTLLVHNCIVNAANEVLDSHSRNGPVNNPDALVNLLQVFIVLTELLKLLCTKLCKPQVKLIELCFVRNETVSHPAWLILK